MAGGGPLQHTTHTHINRIRPLLLADFDFQTRFLFVLRINLQLLELSFSPFLNPLLLNKWENLRLFGSVFALIKGL